MHPKFLCPYRLSAPVHEDVYVIYRICCPSKTSFRLFWPSMQKKRRIWRKQPFAHHHLTFLCKTSFCLLVFLEAKVVQIWVQLSPNFLGRIQAYIGPSIDLSRKLRKFFKKIIKAFILSIWLWVNINKIFSKFTFILFSSKPYSNYIRLPMWILVSTFWSILDKIFMYVALLWIEYCYFHQRPLQQTIFYGEPSTCI